MKFNRLYILKNSTRDLFSRSTREMIIMSVKGIKKAKMPKIINRKHRATPKNFNEKYNNTYISLKK